MLNDDVDDYITGSNFHGWEGFLYERFAYQDMCMHKSMISKNELIYIIVCKAYQGIGTDLLT